MIKKISNPSLSLRPPFFWNWNLPEKDPFRLTNIQIHSWNCSSGHIPITHGQSHLDSSISPILFTPTSHFHCFDNPRSFRCRTPQIIRWICRLFLGFWDVFSICLSLNVLWYFWDRSLRRLLDRRDGFRNRTRTFLRVSVDRSSHPDSFSASPAF